MVLSQSQLQDPASWPSEVNFIPYVGDRYGVGIDGLKVLILGESHYVKDPNEIESIGGIRLLTRHVFEGCAREGSRAWGNFFRKLDVVVARHKSPTDEEAREGWRHIAYANFVQFPVGSGARIRPNDDGWDSGRTAFPKIISILHPDIIFVVGKQAYNNTPNKPGRRDGEIKLVSSATPRELWKVDYEDESGSALMTWAYHPSWPRDGAPVYVELFNRLLEAAKRK